MTALVSTSNSQLLEQLRSPPFRAARLAHHVASTGRETLALIRRLAPAAALVEGELPDVDGYTVCKEVRTDPALRRTRLILVVTTAVVRADLLRLVTMSGCDDLVCLPLPTAALYDHLAAIMGLPPANGPDQGPACAWEITETCAGLRVRFSGDLAESTDLAPLAARLNGALRIVFDMRDLRRVDSYGVHEWCAFLRGLGRRRYTFEHCSPAFVHEAALVSGFLGTGVVASVTAP